MVLKVEYVFFVLVMGIAFSVAASCAGCNPDYGVDGKKVYEGECGICHGENGRQGTSGASDLSTSKMSMEDRIDIITNGSDNDQMLPFKDNLSKKQIKAVAEYIETLRK
jgi:mono/diheme cytochrome c family protein